MPPSLRNVFKELRDDLGVTPPASGDLSGWAAQGVLLLNAVLTVRAGKPGSHARQGWEHVTDAAIRALDASDERVVFLLWGGYARRKAPLVTAAHHWCWRRRPQSDERPRVPWRSAVQQGKRPLVQRSAAGRCHWRDTRLGE